MSDVHKGLAARACVRRCYRCGWYWYNEVQGRGPGRGRGGGGVGRVDPVEDEGQDHGRESRLPGHFGPPASTTPIKASDFWIIDRKI